MTEEVEYLDMEDVLGLAVVLLGDPPPVRDLGLLEAAVARPRASAFGQDAYPDLWSKAAALIQSVVKNHPLADGNKRLGWLAVAVFLELNGVVVTSAANDDVYNLVVRLAAGQPSIGEIGQALETIVRA